MWRVYNRDETVGKVRESGYCNIGDVGVRGTSTRLLRHSLGEEGIHRWDLLHWPANRAGPSKVTPHVLHTTTIGRAVTQYLVC